MYSVLPYNEKGPPLKSPQQYITTIYFCECTIELSNPVDGVIKNEAMQRYSIAVLKGLCCCYVSGQIEKPLRDFSQSRYPVANLLFFLL